MIAGIEMGGTKTVVAVGEADGTVHEEFRYPTTDGPGTYARAIEWLRERGTPEAVGVAAFGPVSVNKNRADYGRMLATPKPGWAGFSIVGALEGAFPSARIALETDVNAAALAERDGLDNVIYITIGTGIGGGGLIDGRMLRGAVHSEFGHWLPRRAPGDDFAGVCPFHGDCLEGLASGPAIARRWGMEAKDLAPDHKAWEFESFYLAQAVMTLLATVCPERVVIGGGVSQAEDFHKLVEEKVRDWAEGYFPALEENRPFVVAPQHEQQAGIKGALMLCQG
ncbi:ROK family protein [Haloferula rosea]|uniref:fructokinase n=1 Tax=Haloferula rosea TaxID=490093 RepID=A0A934RBL9_9BACT|nr:ROK family protein [Haloferula rosea]MBK1828674.1 ROK family protein [Haloferula rosea]